MDKTMQSLFFHLFLNLCDDFHFHEHSLWQFRRSHTGTGRLAGEAFAVNGVERRKIGHVFEEAGSLDRFLRRRPRRFQHSGQVFHHLPGLSLNIRCFHLPGGRMNRNLSRRVDQSAADNCLGIRADSLRRTVGFNFFSWVVPPLC